MRRKRILVIDDNPDEVATLTLLLREEGHTVEYATNALYALTLASTFRPEFVFLDIGMPYMDGYETARRLRAKFKDTRLFAISGLSGEEARKKSLDQGFEEHLVKPFDFTLIEKILASDGSTPLRG